MIILCKPAIHNGIYIAYTLFVSNTYAFMKKFKHIKNVQKISSSGLTLVELLIAIAIIAILASIAIPSYEDYKEKARVTQAVEDMASISLHIGQYWQDARAYPDTLADVGQNKTDPWGNPYQYLNLDKNGNGGARRDKNLNPLNSDFDLYSRGKDNKSKLPISQKDSLDDVLRANDGKFMDLAKNY
jgi:general secretion pathway protein G